MADDEETPSITYEYMDGEQETTTWLKRAGKCKITYPSGAIYEGQVNDLKEKHGLGKYTYPSEPKEDGDDEEEGAEDAPRTVYEGQWLNGKKSGTGAMIYANGDAYYGQFKNNKSNGDGSYKYKNGDIYSGQWTNGKKNGNGTYLFAANDSQLVGTWDMNNLKTGRWIYKDGSSWHGNFKNGNPFGKGMYYFKNGNQQKGEYVEIVKEDAEEEDATDLVWQGLNLEKASVNPNELAAIEKNKCTN